MFCNFEDWHSIIVSHENDINLVSMPSPRYLLPCVQNMVYATMSLLPHNVTAATTTLANPLEALPTLYNML